MICNLENNNGRIWHEFPKGFVKGFAYIGEQLLREENLYFECIDAIENNLLQDWLKKLNGNFSAVIHIKDKIFLIVDKLRSYPLFYYQSEDNIYICDIGENMLNFLPKKLNRMAVYELLSLGYLSFDTLIENVYSVNAGSYVVIEPNHNVDIFLYFSYIFDKKQINKEELFNLSSKRLEDGFRKIQNTIGKHTILLPLSGGYDSRLVACLCKKAGLDNVICFTYGIKDSFDVVFSKKVADALGYKWYFVEYTKELWDTFLSSQDFIDYCRYAGNLTANPHFQDLPALLKLKKEGIIHQNMIVMPGHSGDLLGGSKIPISILEKHKIKLTHEFLSKMIYENFYDLNKIPSSQKKIIIEKNKKLISQLSLNNIDDLLDIYESFWFVKSKVANFLVNSMRGYEFVGLEWRLPLWDDTYAELWYSIPWSYKYYSSLYNDFMFVKYFEPFNVNFYKKTSVTNRELFISIKKRLPIFISKPLRNSVHKIRALLYHQNINAFDDVVSLLIHNEQLDKKKTGNYKLVKNCYKINAVVAKYYLKLLSPTALR